MKKILYLKITKFIDKMETFDDFLKIIFNKDFRDILLYGDVTKNEDEYFKLLTKIKNINFNLFIQIKLNYLTKYIDKILEINNIRGIIIELDNDFDKDDIKIIKKLNENLRFISIKIYYEKKYGLKYLDKILFLLKEYRISDLILDSDIKYIEENDKEKYFELFIKYKEFLDKINFQCTFISDFKSNKCLFLEPSSAILVFEDDHFTICPNINIKKNNLNCFENIPVIEDTKKNLIKSRLIKYIRNSKNFHCKDCISEFNSLINN